MPSQSVNRLLIFLMVLGIGIALVGIGLDLIPGSSPGISAPQFLIILSGISLSIVSWFLRSPNRRQHVTSNIGKNLLIVVVVVGIMIVVLEILLSVLSFPVRYPAEIESLTLEPIPYWQCDELGCRYDYDVVQTLCADDQLTGIHCVINEAGFHDTDTFDAASADEHDGLKIMALGDSFTFGASASLGSSFIDTLELNLDDTLIWNLGMPGTGNTQALTLLDRYIDELNPDLVLLGFYMNDYQDNTYPLDQFYIGSVDDSFALIRQYSLTPNGTPIKINNPTHLLYRYHGVEPPTNAVENVLGKTRMGSLVLNTADAFNRVSTSIDGSELQLQRDTTRELLQTIATRVEAHDAQFLVLLIPARNDLQNLDGRLYQTSLELFAELDLTYLDPIDYLDLNTDYDRPPGIHWVTSGHVIVGNLLTDCIRLYQEAGAWQVCDGLENISPDP